MGGQQDILRLLNWQQVWEGAYGKNLMPPEPEFDITTWVSSYTGQSISSEEMHEWVLSSVRPILAIHPHAIPQNSILEIGCGTGLMLYPLAEHCSEYVGIDYSKFALQTLQKNIEKKGFRHVKLFHFGADELTKLQEGFFDTIILNSVAQYLPSLEYFEVMLGQALQLLKPNGKIFLGDIRNRNLNELFQVSVKFFKSSPDTTIDNFITSYKRKALAEKELLYSPEYFMELPKKYPNILQVKVELRRGNFLNEMTAYRYNVVLDTERKKIPKITHTIDWQTEGFSIEKFHKYFQTATDVVCISSITNQRTFQERNIEKMIQAEDKPKTIGDLRQALEKRKLEEKNMSPEYFWKIADAYGVPVEITWNTTDNTCFDVIFNFSRH